MNMETKKILIVDDDADVISMLKPFLEKEGYTVVTASNKTEGLAKAKSEKPDLAILDVMMTTHYEGFELRQELLEDAELKNIPVLMESSIELLSTSRSDVQAMAREYRKNPEYKDLQVLLLRDANTGNAGVDYRTESGNSVFFPVNGFLRKPVNPPKVVEAVNKLLK